jgi:hypothetical protein
MKTLRELQKEVSNLQKELEMRQMLCALVPEKYAMCFKPTYYIDSGYTMGETIHYICNGKEIYIEDNRKYYTGRGAKYKPTHGKIIINFTKKALLEYCKLCYNIRVAQIRKNLTEDMEISKKRSELLKKCISTESKYNSLYIGL